jgi:hypothetical protein
MQESLQKLYDYLTSVDTNESREMLGELLKITEELNIEILM